MRNKAFFFGNVDFERRDNPSGFSVGTHRAAVRPRSGGRSVPQHPAGPRYNYDPGGKEEFIRTNDSDKFFVRGDFNLSRQPSADRPPQLLDALNDIGRPTATLVLPAGRLLSDQEQDELDGRAVEQHVRHRRQRSCASRFSASGTAAVASRSRTAVPAACQVDLSRGTVRAGRENFSTANELDQDVYELTDDFTWLKGKHTLTFGTHNEFFKFRNLFIRDIFGNYRFANLDLFEQGLAQSYDYSFSLTGDPLQAAKFRVRQFGFYAGDQWRPALELDAHLRACVRTSRRSRTSRRPTRQREQLSVCDR